MIEAIGPQVRTFRPKEGVAPSRYNRQGNGKGGDFVNLILLSGDYAKIHAAAMITMVAASLGQPVHIFVSMEALPAFHQDASVRAQIPQGPMGQKIVASQGQDYLEIFRQAKEFGDVKIYACSLVMDITHWTLDDLAPIFDETLGLTAFMGQVGDGLSLTF